MRSLASLMTFFQMVDGGEDVIDGGASNDALDFSGGRDE